MDARNPRRRWALLSGLLCLAAPAIHAEDGKRLLSEGELDRITAGAASVSKTEELLTFEAVKKTQSGRTVTADGTIELVESLEGLTLGRLTLNGNAQQNLQSMININAVNSAVNVLLNLNVSIDSEVGSINQINLNDLPRGLRPPLPGAGTP